MAKSKEQKLRAQLEILKAQVKNQTSGTKNSLPEVGAGIVKESITKPLISSAAKASDSTHHLNLRDINSDLKKTVFYSLFLGGVLLLLYLTEPQWLNIFKF